MFTDELERLRSPRNHGGFGTPLAPPPPPLSCPLAVAADPPTHRKRESTTTNTEPRWNRATQGRSCRLPRTGTPAFTKDATRKDTT
jgi:hypothetical protein